VTDTTCGMGVGAKKERLSHFFLFGLCVCQAGVPPHKQCLQAFFSLVILEIGSHFLFRLAWTVTSYFSFLTVTGMTGHTATARFSLLR
jgi:hypothetical protein